MSAGLLGLLAAVGILVGLAGVVLPMVPGLLLVLVATAGSLLLLDPSGGVWVVVVLLVVVAGFGTAMSMVLPARRAAVDGAPRRTLLAAGIGGVVGFVVIPVLGLVVGAVAGLLLAEHERLGEWQPAWASARRVLSAYGLGVLLELLAGVVMGVVWLATFLVVAT